MIRAVVGVCLILMSHWPPAAAAAVRLGNEVLAAEGFRRLQGKRVGLLTNPSGVNSQLESTIDQLRRAPGVRLVALFSGEHGLYGDIPAGQEIKNSTDERTRLPVYSLYGPGPTRKPTPGMLRGIDALVYDLQDTGCRAYTFISTMGLAMEACGELGVEFVVLDRPNPIGGERVEGPRLNPRFRSFVGQWDIPYVYGLTCGELARMIAGERWIKTPCKLTVVPMQGWQRWMVWRDTQLPWVPTSPFVPTGDAPMFQVATGMLGEIGGLNIGNSLNLPFQCLAAPELDAQRFCDYLNAYRAPGVTFRPAKFRAAQGQSKLSGAQIHFTDPHRAPLTAINFMALEAMKRVGGRDLFATAAEAGKSFAMFDKVNGTDATRLDLEKGRSASQVIQSWRPGEKAFREQRRRYLIY
jgi:uncharacterized protein YbbC (DUF1343 family)